MTQEEMNKIIAEFDGKSFVQFQDDALNTVFEGWVWCEQGKNKQANKLKYHTSWDELMPVVEKIATILAEGIEGRDTLYAIRYLLGGGYRFGTKEPLPFLKFSKENLFIRSSQFIDWYNQNNKPYVK